MKTQHSHRPASNTGSSLITTLVLTVAAAVLMASTLSRTLSGSKLNDRNNAFIIGTAAAESATEKVIARMSVDFANGGEAQLAANLSLYQTTLTPSTNETAFWTNFIFSDGQGHVNQTYVSRTTTNAAGNEPYVLLESQYPGLYAFAATYRIISDVTPAHNGYAYYNFTNAVCQDVQMAEIPVFQFAIFYNGLLEFTDCAPLTVNGRVQCNSNIYVGCPSGSSLAFNYFVSASGSITNPGWFGYAQSSYSSNSITYSGTPTPGWGTGEAVLTLPMGAATNNPYAIVQLPTATEDSTSPSTNTLSQQRYYYKSMMQIFVTNITTALNGTNVTNVLTTVKIKGSMFDSAPLVFSYTNNLPTNTAALSNNFVRMTTNWAWFGASNWLSTNSTFWDARQGQTNHVTQIDLAKFGTWIATNTNVLAKWNATTPFNGIIYIADLRTTNSMYMNCVRLTNGQTIPSRAATNNAANTYSIPGLTIATINPLYIQGLYNCPSASNLNSTNTIGCRPCSVICDALTILSTNWVDPNSWKVQSGAISMPTASTSDTVNTAIIAGNVPSTGSTAAQFSGGVHNLTRLLEDWGSSTLYLNTSIINLFPSAQATQQFQKPGIYYNAPTRKFSFDLNFTLSTNLPPGTPLVNRMIRGTWWTPKPNHVADNPDPSQFFVPQ